MRKIACKALPTFSLLYLFVSTNVFANLENVRTIADVSETLISGTDFVTKLLLAAALVLGIGFLLFSISTYRQHRLTPKLIPLDRPILYFVLGATLCAIPFLNNIFGLKTFSTLDLKREGSSFFSKAPQKSSKNYGWDIDAPLELEPVEVAGDGR